MRLFHILQRLITEHTKRLLDVVGENAYQHTLVLFFTNMSDISLALFLTCSAVSGLHQQDLTGNDA